jgi:hypothetical protein
MVWVLTVYRRVSRQCRFTFPSRFLFSSYPHLLWSPRALPIHVRSGFLSELERGGGSGSLGRRPQQRIRRKRARQMGQSVHFARPACPPGMATCVGYYFLFERLNSSSRCRWPVLPADPPQPLVQRETLISGRLPGPVHGSATQVKEMLRNVADSFRPDPRTNTRKFDIITRAMLPCKLDESMCRQCTKCGSLSMISPSRTNQEGGEEGFVAFEAAFRRRCICGGLWSRFQS